MFSRCSPGCDFANRYSSFAVETAQEMFNHFQSPGLIVLAYLDCQEYERKDNYGAAIGEDYVNPVDLRDDKITSGGIQLENN